MDLRKIKALIDLLDKSNLAELEIKEGEESVRLARHSSVAPQMMMSAPPMQMHAAEHHRPAAPAQPMPAVAATATEEWRARRTDSSPSLISSSARLDLSSRSIRALILRRSMAASSVR